MVINSYRYEVLQVVHEMPQTYLVSRDCHLSSFNLVHLRPFRPSRVMKCTAMQDRLEDYLSRPITDSFHAMSFLKHFSERAWNKTNLTDGKLSCSLHTLNLCSCTRQYSNLI